MLSLALSLLFTDTVLRARRTPTVPKRGRRMRFTCINMITRPVNWEEENGSHRRTLWRHCLLEMFWRRFCTEQRLFFPKSNQLDFTYTAVPLNNPRQNVQNRRLRRSTVCFPTFVYKNKKKQKWENELKIKSSVASQVEQKKDHQSTANIETLDWS